MIKPNLIRKVSKFVVVGMLMLPIVSTTELSAKSMVSIEQYEDVKPSFWGYQTIQWGLEKQIISGYPDHTMKPDHPVKESEFLAMLLRYYSNTQKSTIDTPIKNWAEPFYKKAKELNWTVNGISTVKPIHRGQVAQLIADSQGYQYDMNNSIQYLINFGLAKGRNGYTIEGFEKDGQLTRVEALQFIKNLEDKELKQAKKRGSEFSPTLVKPKQVLREITVNGKQGLIDSNGKVIIPPKYKYIGEPYGNEPIKVILSVDPVSSEREISFINRQGNFITKQKYKEAGEFSEGLAYVRIPNTKINPESSDSFGYINESGKLVIPAKFNNASNFTNGRAIVEFWEGKPLALKRAIIDRNGKVISELKFDYEGDYQDGLVLVSNSTPNGSSLYGYADIRSGKMITPIQYTHAQSFSEGLAAVSINGQETGFIDSTGRMVIEPKFRFAGNFSEGLAVAALKTENGSKLGYIDYKGKWIIEPLYDDAQPFSEGLAAVRVGGKWGYIDRSNQWILKPQYKYANIFIAGLAANSIDDTGTTWGYINKQGKIVRKIQ
ncbi:WG repeat-containing protein [Brevibacillus formosus]|uniref:WG repeat-containing protein n=1 Tax=Brevibacillus formosus TaxID=54913 RepID=UPI003F1DA2F4